MLTRRKAGGKGHPDLRTPHLSRGLLTLGLTIGLWYLPAAAQVVELYRDHWGWEFVERLKVQGLISPLLTSVGPGLRGDVAEGLRSAWRSLAEDPTLLSATERALLAQLSSDFSEELLSAGRKSPALPSERHLIAISDSTLHARLDLLLRQEVHSRRGTAYQPAQLKAVTTGGILARGSIGGTLWFYLDARNTATRGGEVPEKEHFDPAQGQPIVTSGRTVYSDVATAYLAARTPWFSFQAGRGCLWWGPSPRSGLILSASVPPFDFLRLDARWKRLRFTYLHAELRSPFGRKFLAGHRLDWMARSNLLVGASETVVYGLRNAELAYLNPIMPYHIAEHHLGDRDNNNISLDFWWRIRKGLASYGELLIDDLTLSAPLFRYWGNKFGVLLGAQWLNPVGLADSQIRLEYTRIEPYVYTHYDSVNRYQHYDQILGNSLGPNADEWYVELSRYFGRDFRCLFWTSLVRKGEGEVSRAHVAADGNGKSFLQGVVERRRVLGIEVRDQVRRDVFIGLRYFQNWVSNAQHRPGHRSHGRAFVASLYLNY
ncbi:MAG: capsule assembly Wzi family protein [candidate division KSB1 bacterium]|nr:capsule assembly Wzi family protein [candidate division KSB1 bacterium]